MKKQRRWRTGDVWSHVSGVMYVKEDGSFEEDDFAQ